MDTTTTPHLHRRTTVKHPPHLPSPVPRLPSTHTAHLAILSASHKLLSAARPSWLSASSLAVFATQRHARLSRIRVGRCCSILLLLLRPALATAPTPASGFLSAPPLSHVHALSQPWFQLHTMTSFGPREPSLLTS
ncbi:hypothetical protein M427DRAFT_39634 [Gonapodya prolifera JEL478]|uniref:Uncharacterized protein n=1 Tax=Gonapodya prolifera (strain JEL478) TaxID=1344416 RepID=A0A138ZY55_GONPJ|nr:hypothetical protein M427DRAFT_39634 [Gonapodya prolifera JEL478]|eukprot:KXS09063.1 hypothetical protein M427DRAFT_39634 [Gonapodya prolifera JEL478]